MVFVPNIFVNIYSNKYLLKFNILFSMYLFWILRNPVVLVLLVLKIS